MRKKLAAGNWKMNGLSTDLAQIATLAANHPAAGCEILICPPAPMITAAGAKSGPIAIGAQDCHAETKGAFTGDIAATMLKDAGASHVILGHSERREGHTESDAVVHAKTMAATAAGLTAIVCIGESLDQREAGSTLNVIGTQLAGSLPDNSTADSLVIAYEPIWAIGTGKVPTLGQIGEVHAFIRKTLTDRFGPDTGAGIRILYGGSVKPTNAQEIFSVADVDGALVGGASLKAADFSPIIRALESS